MAFLKKLFNSNPLSPKEPIFPEESFTIFKLSFPEGWGLATINKGYDDYKNKSFFCWHVLIELAVIKQNDNGHPTEEESALLNVVEERLTAFLSAAHTVHNIGRVTRRGTREVLYYIDKPRLIQKEVQELCDSIMKEREINFTVEYDPTWKHVSGFIK